MDAERAKINRDQVLEQSPFLSTLITPESEISNNRAQFDNNLANALSEFKKVIDTFTPSDREVFTTTAVRISEENTTLKIVPEKDRTPLVYLLLWMGIELQRPSNVDMFSQEIYERLVNLGYIPDVPKQERLFTIVVDLMKTGATWSKTSLSTPQSSDRSDIPKGIMDSLADLDLSL
jgi:hypothetical protein